MNNFEFSEYFRQRTRKLALRIIILTQSLPKTIENQVIGKQLVRCGTSVAANYGAACRSRSRAEFYSKMNIVVEEADEIVFWLTLLVDAKVFQEGKMESIIKEALRHAQPVKGG